MNIEGTYTLLALPERVWYGMRDQQILLHTVPGIKQIEILDEQTFAIALTINQMGSYEGKLTILEQQFPYHYRIAIQGKNERSQFQGNVSVHLQDREQSTIVTYMGAVHLTSAEQPISTTLARGAAKLLIQQFFTALDDELHANDIRDSDFAAAIERYDVHNTAGMVGIKSKNGAILKRDTTNNIVDISLQSSSVTDYPETGGIVPKLVHLLKLGHGEPVQEQLWTRRLLRASTTSSLLFLVWVGTQIPRQLDRRRSIRN